MDVQQTETNKVSIRVPSEAISRVRKSIKPYRRLKGIGNIELRTSELKPTEKELHIVGDDSAIQEMIRDINKIICAAEMSLRNASRKNHSWTLTDGGELLTPREVHKTGKKAPQCHTTGVGRNHYAARMQGKHKDRERDILKYLKREL